jgi:dipeptidyl aminopeptidase/acylaminoacyl peptidase
MDSERCGCVRVRRTIAIQAAWFLAAIQLLGFGPDAAAKQQKETKRPATEEDAIRMVRIAGTGSINSYAGTLTEDFAYFSPDEKQFVIVLKKGNLERNTNDYSLLLFKTNEAFASPKPKLLAALSSSSNREAITDVAWLSNNDTVLFRGESPGETSQLYSVSVKSGVLRKLTSHPTNLIEFSPDALGHTIVYAAEKPKPKALTDQSAHEGVVVANEDMSELLMGVRTDEIRDLFVLDTRSGESRPLPIVPELHSTFAGNYLHFSLSPDGRYLVARLNLLEVSPSWRNYRQPLLARILDRTLPKNSLTWMFRYAVIDTESGGGRVLLDGPVSYYGSDVVWGGDSKSVVLTGVLLPLDMAAGNPKRLRDPAVVVVDLESLAFDVLSDDDLRFVRRERSGQQFAFETRPSGGSGPPGEFRYFHQSGAHWVQDEIGTPAAPSLVVATLQDVNTPPKITVSDPQTARKATLLDLNPQFREIEFGRVEEISFAGAEHKNVHAGLYFPPGYVAGQKYPLVLQTHGFDAKSFWIDGSFTTAFAAQALAGRGFLVLQVPDIHDWDETPAEAPNMMETLERAVEYVDSLGCLDRDRLGITGFSRTGFYVHYMLEHSKLHFGAAIVADGSDGGYSQYLQFLNAHSFTASDSEMLNGGVPFGSTLLFWLRRSPEFSLDLIKTPLMLQSNTPEFLATMWAPYVGLKRLGVPVELVFFPTGTHIMEKPWDRLVSQGAAVDWFAFWLKGKESVDAAKAERYRRWETLRNLQTDASHSAQTVQPSQK